MAVRQKNIILSQQEEYTMAERKTQDVLKADQMVHLYQGNIQKVYVAGEVYHYENERDGKKTYVQEFYGSYVAPDANGTFDDKKRGLFRAVTTEPFKDLSECAGKDMLILVSGQTFKVEDENKVLERYKFVRWGFVQALVNSDSHWMDRPIIPNQLARGCDIFKFG